MKTDKEKTEKRGRKPVKDKVIGLTIYVKESIVKKSGGKAKARSILLDRLKSS